MNGASERLAAAAVAMGERPADLVIKGGRLLEVHTGIIEPADIAVAGRRIAYVGKVDHTVGPDTKTIDFDGLVLIPGMVDPHIHIGGSQLSIERLAEVLVPLGTAAIATDFYEPGSLGGIAAIEAMLDRSDPTGLHILFSPFHATALGLGSFGNLGRATLDELSDLALHDRAIAIREWNLASSKIPLEQIDTFYRKAMNRGLALEGHLEGLTGSQLQASVALGVMTDHETSTAAEALEMVRLGVIVQIREGSGARNLEAVAKALTEYGIDPRNFSLSTDEQELHSLARDGHMDRKLRMAVSLGVSPVDAVRMATLNAATSLGVQRDFGSIAPGKVASIAAVEDLRDFEVRRVVSAGVESARDGKYLLEVPVTPYPAAWYDMVNVKGPLQPADFLFDSDLTNAEVRVIGIVPGSLVTEDLTEKVEFDKGMVRSPHLATIAVVDRHSGSGDKGLGLVRGFDFKTGAIATTINPGMMNLMVLGVDPDSMAAAANRVVELKGGIVVAVGGRVVAEIATPLFGILSDAPSVEAIPAATAVAGAIRDQLGIDFDGLVTSVGFACLAVTIPDLKICDKGLVKVWRDRAEAVDFVVKRAS